MHNVRASNANGGFTQTVYINESINLRGDYAITNCTVTTPADSGIGTLRWCLSQAELSDTITFDPASFPPTTPVTITLLSELPYIITDGLTLDASDAGVILDGSQLTGTVDGLHIDGADYVTVRGLQIIGFPDDGIELTNSSSRAMIGGNPSVGDGPLDQGNLISGNGASGILLDNVANITITGNYIGTDYSGTAALGNVERGIEVDQSRENWIEGNLVSGNGYTGIRIFGTTATSNTVIGNRVGTDIHGVAAIGNGAGISIDGSASWNNIGSATDDERNLISGNGTGIGLYDTSHNNIVLGNYIGTNISGTAALSYAQGTGVWIWSGTDNTIGGETANAKNLISGNQIGIRIGAQSASNTVVGNYIGTDSSGSAPIPNTYSGVLIHLDAAHDIVTGNLISGNGGHGVDIIERAFGIQVAGNIIGADVSGSLPLPNGENGVTISYSATESLIGPGNVIAFNGTNGVHVSGADTLSHTITANSILSNAGKGILLTDGGNGGIISPTILNASWARVNGTGPASATIEIFSDSDDEGRIYEGHTQADGTGQWEWSKPTRFIGPYLTATATDPAGNTSEFSYPVAPQATCYAQIESSPTITYTNVQAAVDTASEGDTIKVAGYCAGVEARAGVTQTVYISKSITLRGGYATTNWSTSYPITQPTTLNALGQGRVIYITGDINPTIEGLRITGGDADGLEGTPDAGGGVYIIDATAIISSNQIFNNTASSGGGLYLGGSDATLSDNTITANTAGYGGGLLLRNSDATLSGNTVAANSDGGLHLENSDATLNNNTVSSNTTGSGLYLWDSAAVLNDNTITANSADYGGGLRLDGSDATLNGNTITANTAGWNGGGLYLNGSAATLNGNTISSNTAEYGGGGLYLDKSDIVLDNNFVIGNAAAAGRGGGLYVYASSPLLRHNTIARNHGDTGEGLYVTGAEEPSQPQLYNTILVSHTVGITITAGNRVSLEATLWGTDTWANLTDWGGDGTVVTGSINVWGSPDFVDYATLDYHINADSAAVDAGVCSFLNDDVDGEPRPTAFGPDIGADERPGPGLQLHKRTSHAVRNSGQTVTYTLVVTGVGTGAVDNVILTDVLPLEQRIVASAASSGNCVTDTTQATCTLGTLNVSDSTRITLTAQIITTALPSMLPWPMRNRAWIIGDQASNCAYADAYLHDCHVRLNDGPSEWDDIQMAVDASTRPTDVVKIAGICAGINTRGDTRQVLHISKTVTVQGGYSPANWTTPDPIVNPATLHALGGGRVLYITGDISPTVEGLRITGGNADGLENTPDIGGGVYIIDATAIISGNQIFSNTASSGGGLYLGGNNATLSSNTVSSNTAYEGGGGLYLMNSAAILNGNTVVANTAGYGGGLLLRNSDATLSGNTVTANSDGGLHLENSDATLNNNTVSSNTTGSGLYLWDSAAVLNDNTITANSADHDGGGLYLDVSAATLNGNIITANSAGWNGGGLYLNGSAATLNGNTISSNTAEYGGGGLQLWLSDATLINNIVTDNRAKSAGSGLHIAGSSPRLLHTTVARNSGGNGSSLHATTAYMNGPHFSSAALTNTILVSHTVGVCATDNNTVTSEATLWGNDTDWDGDGTVITGNVNVWGNPDFVNPDARDYHISLESAAIDAGVDAGVAIDIDGDPRPRGFGFDIGADEIKYLYLPLILRGWPPIPEPPELDSIENPDIDGSYDVHWSAVSLADYYDLEEATDSQFTGATIVYTTGTYYPISDKDAKAYYYHVRACNSWACSDWSNVEQTRPWYEQEPNDSCPQEANGPLVSGEEYYGYHNDDSLQQRDYFKFYTISGGNITIDLTDHTGNNNDVQLQLRDQNCVRVAYDWQSPYRIEYTGTAAQWYYIFVSKESSWGSSDTHYVLRATFPTAALRTYHNRHVTAMRNSAD